MITTEKEFRKIHPRAPFLVEKTFGRLLVIDYIPICTKYIYWKCRCVCGNIKNITTCSLTNGSTKSCGCYHKEQTILQRKHSCPINHKYFNLINTTKHAQLLGFIAADGSIGLYNNSWIFSMSITDYDTNIMEAFKRRLEYGGPIKHIKKTKPCHDHVKLTFASERICADLQKYGIFPRKGLSVSTTSLKPPPLQNKRQILSWINGFFMGDGSLYWLTPAPPCGKRKQLWRIDFSGNYNTLTWISQQLYELNIMSRLPKLYKAYHKEYPNNKTYNLIYTKQSDVISFMTAMKNLNITIMSRKFNPLAYKIHRNMRAKWDKRYNPNKKKPTRITKILDKKQFYVF